MVVIQDAVIDPFTGSTCLINRLILLAVRGILGRNWEEKIQNVSKNTQIKKGVTVMDTGSVKDLKRDYLFDNIEDAILKIFCYGVSWIGGVFAPKLNGSLLANQGVFFMFFLSLGMEFILPAMRKKNKKYFTWWSLSFFLILICAILASFGAMYSVLGPCLTPWLFILSCIVMFLLFCDLIKHVCMLVKHSKINYKDQTSQQYEQSVASSYEKNGSEGFLTGGDQK